MTHRFGIKSRLYLSTVRKCRKGGKNNLSIWHKKRRLLALEGATCPGEPDNKTKVYAIDDAELYKYIELPVSTQEDPNSGDNCKCNFHDVSDPKLKTASDKKFLKGETWLQTSEDIQPATITFSTEDEDSVENIAADKLVQALFLPEKRRKLSNNGSDKIATRASIFQVSPVEDKEEEEAGGKIENTSKTGLPSASKRETRAEMRGAKQEHSSPNTASETNFNFNTKSPQSEDCSNYSFVKEEILTDDDETYMNLDNIDRCSDSESSTNSEFEECVDLKSWSREEDALLLQSIKKEYSKQTFVMLSERLTNRTIQEIEERCSLLLNLFQKLP